MKTDYDILIAGGGLNGSALALALAQSGLTVALVDPQPAAPRKADGFDGRGYALSLSSQLLLKATGIWSLIKEDAQPILEIKVTDGRSGEGSSPLMLEFDHAEIEEGPMGYMIEDRFLRRALMASIEAENGVTQMIGEAVTAQDVGPATVTVTLGNGSEISVGVLVGCDGRRSQVAERAGIKRGGWSYGQTALVSAIAHEQPHNGMAHQFFMPSGPLAILPLPGNKSSIVWTETNAEAERIQALNDAEYLDELRPRFGNFLGEINLLGKRFSYPLDLTVAEKFVSERVVLVGDAAHGLHPIAGQGLNAGLKDVGALAEVLVTALRRGEDIGRIDVLERYQQWRRFDVVSLAIATDALNRLFSNDNSLLRIGRDIGLGIFNALPGARRGMIREAAGLTGDIPKLLQGQPI
jgi:2-octaprenyl-6-methoxyphenol hydroxylase